MLALLFSCDVRDGEGGLSRMSTTREISWAVEIPTCCGSLIGLGLACVLHSGTSLI